MSWQPCAFSKTVGLRRALLLVLLVLVLQTAFLPIAAASPVSPSTITVASAPAPLLAEGTGLGRVLSYLEAKLMDRRRMVQLGALGMCIGLYILMRR